MLLSIFLVDDSVASNIAFGVPSDQIEAAVRAAKQAQIHDLIVDDLIVDGLPDGYQAVLVNEVHACPGGNARKSLSLGHFTRP